jgi:hypothetical protein
LIIHVASARHSNSYLLPRDSVHQAPNRIKTEIAMQLSEDWSKILDVDKLSSDEVIALRVIEANIDAIGEYLDKFRSAISLFDYIEEPLKAAAETGMGTVFEISQWHTIAARDGAMTIYHFSDIIIGTSQTVKSCKPLDSLFDWKQYRAAINLYKQFFPTGETMRNAVGHSGEMLSQPAALRHNAFRGSYKGPGLTIGPDGIRGGGPSQMTSIGYSGPSWDGGVILRDCMQGRIYTATKSGSLLTYELSQNSLDKLERVAESFISAFPDDPEDSQIA